MPCRPASNPGQPRGGAPNDDPKSAPKYLQKPLHRVHTPRATPIFQRIANIFRPLPRFPLCWPTVTRDRSLATRRSLVDGLADWGDRRHWQEFHRTYSKLIYSFARRAGLTDAEANDALQETLLTVARRADGFHYDPARGSFKGWLLQIARWRVADQFRKRLPSQPHANHSDAASRTATIARVM